MFELIRLTEHEEKKILYSFYTLTSIQLLRTKLLDLQRPTVRLDTERLKRNP